MEHICVKCNTEMKKVRLVVNGDMIIEKENKKLFDGKNSDVACYVCPTCGYLEYYAECPEAFR